MKDLVLATKNAGKIREIKDLLGDFNINILSQEEACPEITVVEDADTFSGNARKKAFEIMRATSMPSIADDSGLEVSCLGGRPGVYSARYGGEDTPYSQKTAILLEEMKESSDRSARFACALCLMLPSGEYFDIIDYCEGEIAYKAEGEGGFGYDPVFRIPDYNKTFAQIPLEIKNKISHRAKAFSKLKDIIKEIVE